MSKPKYRKLNEEEVKELKKQAQKYWAENPNQDPRVELKIDKDENIRD